MTRGNTVITVSVRECRNVHSPRSEAPLCFVRVEHGARVLGEGGKVTCESGVMNGAVEVTLECDSTQRQTIDELIQNPVLVSLLEVLPRDKKSKEEKTTELGHMTLDLMPLVLGERSLEFTGTLQGGGDLSEKKAEVEVVVSSSQDIVTEDLRAESNVLFLRVRSLHSLPPSWSHTHSPNSHFTLSTPHPLPGLPLSLTGAHIKKAESGDDHTHWKWPAMRGEGMTIERLAVEDETGELRGQEDIPFRRSAECESLRVDWGTELRTWLPPSSPSSPPSLLTILTQSPLWPVEVIKCTTAQTGKGRAKEEDTMTSHHGVAYLDLSPLLYPGTAHIAGAYTLHPFSETDVTAKIRRDYKSVLPSSSSPSLLGGKKTLGVGAGGKSSRRLDSALKLRSGSIVSQVSEDHGMEGEKPTAVPPQDDEKQDVREGVVYEEARTYLWVELQLQRPLVPKRPVSVLAQRVSEYVPQRPAVCRREGGAQRTLAWFHRQTAVITGTLLQEYKELFEAGEDGDKSTVDERRHQFIHHLNSSGKYHTFKELLKHAVVGVVRERYGDQTGFRDSAHRHAFLSQLYTYLTDQLHVSINQGITLDDPPETTPTPVDFDLLKHYAREAEDFQDYVLAEKYYKERVSRADHVAQYWYDYGVFCLLIGQLDKAEQCLKEAVALNQTMTQTLLLYSMLKCIEGQYEEGSEFMELATTSDPTNITAWTIRGLFYEHQTDRVLEEMCYEEAVRLLRGQDEKTFIVPSRTQGGERGGGGGGGGGGDKTGGEGEGSELKPAIGDMRASTLVSSSVDETSVDQPQPEDIAVTVEGTDSNEPSKVELQPEAPPTTVEAPPTTEPPTGRDDPRSIVFLQTASFLLDMHALKFAEMCLAHVQASPSPHSPLYHILEARLHLLRSHPHEAKTCFQDALQMDIQSSWAWSLLGHTHFQLGEFPQARDAYERCLLLQTPPPNLHSVYLHLAHIHLSDKKYSEAKEVCLRACRNTPSGATWRGVGVACYQLGELSEAETALCEANILNNHDPLIWAYLSLVCLKTDRPVEAEQALKFAVKTGLGEEQEVVREIRQEMTSHTQDLSHQHIPHLLTQLMIT